jgi:hypothetical protein
MLQWKSSRAGLVGRIMTAVAEFGDSCTWIPRLSMSNECPITCIEPEVGCGALVGALA